MIKKDQINTLKSYRKNVWKAVVNQREMMEINGLNESACIKPTSCSKALKCKYQLDN